MLKAGWLVAAKNAGINIAISGFDPWPAFRFLGHTSEGNRTICTLFTQEMASSVFAFLVLLSCCGCESKSSPRTKYEHASANNPLPHVRVVFIRLIPNYLDFGTFSLAEATSPAQ
jgi:hypothetical protein